MLFIKFNSHNFLIILISHNFKNKRNRCKIFRKNSVLATKLQKKKEIFRARHRVIRGKIDWKKMEGETGIKPYPEKTDERA